ncbi:uroporphyrinogen decarboxylase [Spirochaetia bacterium]|nr:uroporphyrinogen decarboxylase [Spirochaetia bacterium]
MTNKELVLDALNNKPVPRIPSGFWFHHVPDANGKYQGLRDPAIAEKNVAGHKHYFDIVHPDFVKVMSDGFFGYPLDGAFNDIKIDSIKDLAKIQPVAPDAPWIRGQVDLVKRVTSLQADTMYFYNVFGPLYTLKHLTGLEFVLDLFKKEPALLAETLKNLAQGIALQATSVIREGGADGIYLCVQNPSIGAVSDDEYLKIAAPADQTVLNAANAAGGNNILHICGFKGARNHLNAWTGYKAKAYNWAVNVEGVSLAEGKKLFGGAAVVGGYDNTENGILYRGTKAEVEAFAEKLIKDAGKTGIIVGADCSIPEDIDLARFAWIKDKLASL